MFFNCHALLVLATGCGVGRIPVAPGTMGSLVGLGVAFLFSRLACPTATVAILGLILVAVWISGQAEQVLERKDPGCIVIDEIAGVCVTLACIPFSAGSALAGFLLFRLFDIAKPPPIHYLEKRFAGGWGVVLDDVAAGILAHIVLRIGLAVNS